MSQAAYSTLTIRTAQISVGTSAVPVGTGALGAALAGRVLWRGNAPEPTVQVYIGPLGVTTSTGFPLAPGQDALRPYGPGVALYAVASALTTLYVEESA